MGPAQAFRQLRVEAKISPICFSSGLGTICRSPFKGPLDPYAWVWRLPLLLMTYGLTRTGPS